MKHLMVLLLVTCTFWWGGAHAADVPLLKSSGYLAASKEASTLTLEEQKRVAGERLSMYVKSVVVIQMDRAALKSDQITITLPFGESVLYKRTIPDDGTGWAGISASGGNLALGTTPMRPEIAGMIQEGPRVFRITSLGARQMLSEIDHTNVRPDESEKTYRKMIEGASK